MTSTATTRASVIIDADELIERLRSGPAPVILDVRHTPGGSSRRADYERGHLPGAHWVELASQLAGSRSPGSGNNPLPEPAALQRDVRRWGIEDDRLVVVTGDTGAPSAARAWLVLTWAGVKEVRLLDGGNDAWVAAGGELVTEEPADEEGTFIVTPGSFPTIDADEAAALARTGILLDARGVKQYEGAPAIDGAPAQGHIPGALSAPTSENLDERGRLRSPDELRERFADIGVDGASPVGVYCGGGVAAAHEALALRSIGIDAPVFVGSWSAWSSDPSRPVAVGPEAG